MQTMFYSKNILLFDTTHKTYIYVSHFLVFMWLVWVINNSVSCIIQKIGNKKCEVYLAGAANSIGL